MSSVKYFSAAATTASTTDEALALTAVAAAVATASSLVQASARFTAVGRLHVPSTLLKLGIISYILAFVTVLVESVCMRGVAEILVRNQYHSYTCRCVDIRQ